MRPHLCQAPAARKPFPPPRAHPLAVRMSREQPSWCLPRWMCQWSSCPALHGQHPDTANIPLEEDSGARGPLVEVLSMVLGTGCTSTGAILVTPREHQARCPARPQPCCGSGLASPGPHEQSCGSGGGFCGARLPGRAGTGLSQPRHVPPGMGCVRGLGAAGGAVGSGWGALGRGRCSCQNRLSREHPWGCGRDVRPLPQMWDCKTGVLLQVHLPKPQEALWVQGWGHFQST